MYPLMYFRLIDGQEYDGVVKAKEQAEQQYAQAVSHGESAGIVRYSSSDQFIYILHKICFTFLC